MQIQDYALVIGAGMIAGFINTVAGGGSLLTLPILIFLGLPAGIANATNRIALFFQNIFAVAGFKSKGISPLPYGAYLSVTALIGAAGGAYFSSMLDDETFKKIIAVVMLCVVAITILSPSNKGTASEERMTFKHQVIGSIVFFFVGFYGGFIQAGVGFLVIASLVGINHLSLVKTNAIKVFVILIYTMAAIGVFMYKGMINWHYGIALAVGNSTGAWIASRWSVKAGDKWIKRFLIVTVIGMAIKLLFYS